LLKLIQELVNMLKESAKPKDLIRINKIASKLKFRSNFLFYLRKFFIENNFIEIDTPVMIKAPAPEDYINAPQVGNLFLRTSPELHMKRLAAAGFNKLFQLGPCFREDEIGRLHNVEFTMLEWYEKESNYIEFMHFLKKMLNTIIHQSCGTLKIKYGAEFIDFSREWEIITVKDAFKKYASTTPEDAIRDDNFEILLTEKIEPNLPKDRPVIMKDYPLAMAALSKVNKEDPTVAERWELYLGGIEIANTYSELTNFKEQRKRFTKAHLNRRYNDLPEYPEDNEFYSALEYGLPEFGGSALGIDRLIMILTDSHNIKDVISFIE
jgi:elongation factor P--(R)-beta-lysine ligase